MKQFYLQLFDLQLSKEAFPGSDVVISFSFKTVKTRDNCVHSASFSHRFVPVSLDPRGQSAHFWKSDCFECLSPRIKVSGGAASLRPARIAA